MTKAQAVKALLDRLRSALGTGESPPNSNRNYIVTWYNETVEKIGAGPWCQMTVTWGFWTAVGRIVRGRAYTVWAAEDFAIRGEGQWITSIHSAQPGDMVFFDWKGAKEIRFIDHVGTVEKNNGDGTIYTLEGNYGDRMVRMKRDAKYIVGFGRPDWSKVAGSTGGSSAPSTPKPQPKPGKTRLTADGKFGPSTTKRAQQVFKSGAADGVVSNQTYGIRNDNPGLRARDNWEFNGSRKGSDLIRAIQRSLAKRKGKARYTGKVDGLAGPAFWTAMQGWLGTKADGKVSDPSDVVRAFQRWLNDQD